MFRMWCPLRQWDRFLAATGFEDLIHIKISTDRAVPKRFVTISPQHSCEMQTVAIPPAVRPLRKPRSVHPDMPTHLPTPFRNHRQTKDMKATIAIAALESEYFRFIPVYWIGRMNSEKHCQTPQLHHLHAFSTTTDFKAMHSSLRKRTSAHTFLANEKTPLCLCGTRLRHATVKQEESTFRKGAKVYRGCETFREELPFYLFSQNNVPFSLKLLHWRQRYQEL